MPGSQSSEACSKQAALGGYYEGKESRNSESLPAGFMKHTNRPIINFLLAFLSLLSLTLLPAVASPQSCCMSTESAAKACLCSRASQCCQDSSPSTMAVDRASSTVKPLRHAQVPYNAAVWTPASRLTRLAAVQPIFRKPVHQVDSNNKRYLMLRVLLI